MASKKTSKSEESGFGALGALFSTLLVAPLISKVEGFVMNSLTELKDNTEDYLKSWIKIFLLVGVAFAGVMFILVGLARLVNETLGRDGVGEIIIGLTILLIALVWHALPGKRK